MGPPGARHPDQRRVVQVGLRLDELLDDRVVAIARLPNQRRVAVTFADVQVGLRLDEVLDGRVVAIARHPDQRRVVQVAIARHPDQRRVVAIARRFFERPGELEPDTVYWSSDMLVALRARYR